MTGVLHRFPDVLRRLRARYAEPHRAYHGQAHVDTMLRGFAAARGEFAAPDAAELAIWFHDAVYDPAARDNEARSAVLLVSELSGLLDPGLLEAAALLIRLTADHTVPRGLPPAVAADAAILLDLDMAILGAPAAEFDAYERGIEAEYRPVHGAERFRAGRRQFLLATLARPRLFLTDKAHGRLDATARANIRRALAALGGKSS